MRLNVRLNWLTIDYSSYNMIEIIWKSLQDPIQWNTTNPCIPDLDWSGFAKFQWKHNSFWLATALPQYHEWNHNQMQMRLGQSAQCQMDYISVVRFEYYWRRLLRPSWIYFPETALSFDLLPFAIQQDQSWDKESHIARSHITDRDQEKHSD